jgi:AraC-like DNA-binding protein
LSVDELLWDAREPGSNASKNVYGSRGKPGIGEAAEFVLGHVTVRQPDDDEFARWRDVVSSAFMPVDLVPYLDGGKAPRAGGLTARALGFLQVSEVSGSAVDVHRTRAAIRHGDPEQVKVVMLLRGRGLVALRDQKAEFGPGDFVVYDTSEPYLMRFEHDYSLFVMMFPRTAVKMPAHGLSTRMVPVRAERGVGALVSAFLNSLRYGLATGSLDANPRLEEAAVDLVCASLADNASSIDGAPGAVILARAKSFIDAHHADPALNSSMVAAAHHISTRYLQKLFARGGVTVTGFIKERRLERCRYDLEERSLSGDSIGAVCARHGFIDPGHFSRLFKERYGMSPRAFREQARTRL